MDSNTPDQVEREFSSDCPQSDYQEWMQDFGLAMIGKYGKRFRGFTVHFEPTSSPRRRKAVMTVKVKKRTVADFIFFGVR